MLIFWYYWLHLSCPSEVGIHINLFVFGYLQDVDYEATLATKLAIARKVFNQEKDLILNSSAFQKFFSENEVLIEFD